MYFFFFIQGALVFLLRFFVDAEKPGDAVKYCDAFLSGKENRPLSSIGSYQTQFDVAKVRIWFNLWLDFRYPWNSFWEIKLFCYMKQLFSEAHWLPVFGVVRITCLTKDMVKTLSASWVKKKNKKNQQQQNILAYHFKISFISSICLKI